MRIPQEPVSLYLDVLKRSLVNWYYGDMVTHEMDEWSMSRRLLRKLLRLYGLKAVVPQPIEQEVLLEGRGMCTDAYYDGGPQETR